jgi:hypothetical protein
MKNLLIILILGIILISCEDSESVYDPNKGFEIIDFSPKAAYVNDTISISCRNLSSDINLISVFIGSFKTQIISEIENSGKNISLIKIIVPTQAKTELIRIYSIKYSTISKDSLQVLPEPIDTLPDTFPKPSVGVLYPPSGCPGTVITIPGKGFLPYKKSMKVILGVLEYDLFNITDDKAQFILPDILTHFNVFLKFNNDIVIPVTSTKVNSIAKLLVGRDNNFTFWPTYSLENDIISLKVFYQGNSKPRVFFGNVESEVIDYKPVRYEYRYNNPGPSTKLDYYDGFINCKVPKVNEPCKIRVVTDCGEIQSSLEYNNMNFRTVIAVVKELTAKLKKLSFYDTIPTFYTATMTANFALLDLKHMKKAENGFFYYFYDAVGTDNSGYSNGERFSYKFNLSERYVIIGYDMVSGSGGNHTGSTSYSSFEITVKNLKVIETDSQIIYYLSGEELKNNITAWWKKEGNTRANGGSVRVYYDELVELIDFTDSTTVQLILNK